MLLMGAILELTGFAHVLVYGPSGVGKTIMIEQITRRLNGTTVEQNGFHGVCESDYRNGNVSPMALLLVETRPPNDGVFNRADYYHMALTLLGEPFYERRMMVDIDAEQTWEKKGRGSGTSGGKLLDQLDWIKSIMNVTGVLHILISTYELLSFRNLGG